MAKRVNYTQAEIDAFKAQAGGDLLGSAPTRGTDGESQGAPEASGGLEDPLGTGEAYPMPEGAQEGTFPGDGGAPAIDNAPPIDNAPLAGAQQAKPQPEAPAERRMTNYEVIESELRDKKNTSRLSLALGFTGKDERGRTEAFKYISSVLQEIKKTEGDPKKDLTVCTIDSIISAMIDAANFRLPIDGRGLAHLVKYINKATLQIGYKGFLFKIAEHYKDVDFTAEPVFEGDELTLSDVGGFQTYTHIRKDPFQRDQSKMTGLITCLCYTDGAGRHSKIAAIPKGEIDQIRKAAKQDFIWAAWFFEKAKVAGLKRLCKIHFATVLGVQEMAEYDNAAHFILDTPEGSRIAPSSSEELQKKLSYQPGVTLDTTVKTEPEKVPVAAPAATQPVVVNNTIVTTHEGAKNEPQKSQGAAQAGPPTVGRSAGAQAGDVRKTGNNRPQ